MTIALTLHVLLIILALICEGIATFGPPWPKRINLVALGLVFFILSFVF